MPWNIVSYSQPEAKEVGDDPTENGSIVYVVDVVVEFYDPISKQVTETREFEIEFPTTGNAPTVPSDADIVTAINQYIAQNLEQGITTQIVSPQTLIAIIDDIAGSDTSPRNKDTNTVADPADQGNDDIMPIF